MCFSWEKQGPDTCGEKHTDIQRYPTPEPWMRATVEELWRKFAPASFKVVEDAGLEMPHLSEEPQHGCTMAHKSCLEDEIGLDLINLVADKWEPFHLLATAQFVVEAEASRAWSPELYRELLEGSEVLSSPPRTGAYVAPAPGSPPWPPVYPSAEERYYKDLVRVRQTIVDLMIGFDGIKKKGANGFRVSQTTKYPTSNATWCPLSSPSSKDKTAFGSAEGDSQASLDEDILRLTETIIRMLGLEDDTFFSVKLEEMNARLSKDGSDKNGPNEAMEEEEEEEWPGDRDFSPFFIPKNDHRRIPISFFWEAVLHKVEYLVADNEGTPTHKDTYTPVNQLGNTSPTGSESSDDIRIGSPSSSNVSLDRDMPSPIIFQPRPTLARDTTLFDVLVNGWRGDGGN